MTFAADIVRKEEEEGYTSPKPRPSQVTRTRMMLDGVEDEEYEDEDDNDAIRMRCCQRVATRYADGGRASVLEAAIDRILKQIERCRPAAGLR